MLRWHDSDDPIRTDPRKALTEEMADVLIFLVHLGDALDVDPAEALHAEIDANEERFPTSTKRRSSSLRDAKVPEAALRPAAGQGY